MSKGQSEPVDLRKAAKDALLAGLVAFGLFAPVVGLVTVQNMANRLVLETRWPVVAAMVAIVIVGRFLLTTQVWPRLAAYKLRPVRAPTSSMTAFKEWFSRFGGPLMLGIVVVYPFAMLSIYGPGGSIKWIDNFGIQILIYIMLGWGLNIVVGLAGLLDLGYVAFYAVGAYSYAIMATEFGYSFWILMPVAGILAAFWGIILGFPVLRLRGDYLAIVTLAFGEIIRIVLLNWYSVTNGPNGISRIPRPSFFGLSFDRNAENSFHGFFGLEYSSVYRVIFMYYLILALALLVNFVTKRLRKLPLGRAWEALREDEIACRALGINPTNTKLSAFAIGAMFGGFAGSFFATRQGFISPESFTFIESAIILAIVVLGGMGSQIGVVIAAVLLIGLPEIFRELQAYRMVAFGAAMVLIMVWRPAGLLSHRQPTLSLSPSAPRAGPAQ